MQSAGGGGEGAEGSGNPPAPIRWRASFSTLINTHLVHGPHMRPEVGDESALDPVPQLDRLVKRRRQNPPPVGRKLDLKDVDGVGAWVEAECISLGSEGPRGPASKGKARIKRKDAVCLVIHGYFLALWGVIYSTVGGPSRPPHEGPSHAVHMSCTSRPPTWFTSCMCPVMRATCCLLADGCHRNMVKSSEPETMRSGWPAVAVWYLQGGEGGRS